MAERDDSLRLDFSAHFQLLRGLRASKEEKFQQNNQLSCFFNALSYEKDQKNQVCFGYIKDFKACKKTRVNSSFFVGAEWGKCGRLDVHSVSFLPIFFVPTLCSGLAPTQNFSFFQVMHHLREHHRNVASMLIAKSLGMRNGWSF